MPPIGADRQRGGWYDVMERDKTDGQEWYRFTWHDRKAWWQQEQAILAYLILAGIARRRRVPRARRGDAAAFYNAWFLDHDDGRRLLQRPRDGMPYLLGTERLKGSHSMSAYHDTELCYLAAVYTNLLLTKQPLDLHFKPRGDGFKDRILRVSPDILPPGSIKIESVWMNGQPWSEFDAEKLTVTLPPGGEECTVKVRVVSALETFESRSSRPTGRRRSPSPASSTRLWPRRSSATSGRRWSKPGPHRPARRRARVDVERRRAGAPLPAAEAAVRGHRGGHRRRDARGAGSGRLVDTDEQSFTFVDDIKKLKPLK